MYKRLNVFEQKCGLRLAGGAVLKDGTPIYNGEVRFFAVAISAGACKYLRLKNCSVLSEVMVILFFC